MFSASMVDGWMDRYARVLLRVGLDLAPGQPLLITDPFELQGVPQEAEPLLAQIRSHAKELGAGPVEVIPLEPETLREAARRWPEPEFEAHLGRQNRQLMTAVQNGAAVLLLEGMHPGLFAGMLHERVTGLRQAARAAFAPVSARLVAAATNWTVAPLPNRRWADAVFPELPASDRAARLWSVLAASCRLEAPDPINAWHEHLRRLGDLRDQLQRRPLRGLRYRGEGTDLEVALPPGHRWCTAQLRTPAGRAFIPNLPTEEVFTAPLAGSTNGTLRVARPVLISGQLVEDIALTFRDGEVVEASAGDGAEILETLLNTDAGAMRLGEVAWVPEANALTRERRSLLHPLFDENALPHVALGDGYPFTGSPAVPPNRSAIHVDLPLEAEVSFL